jgi:dTDP-4-amino-4,6-dideoxy-D-galactose acyltransferase
MITPLTWDSTFFGFSLARVTGSTLDAASASEAVALARAQQVACLSLLLPASDAASIAAAQDAGFHLVDVRTTLERPAGQSLPADPGLRVRARSEADLPVLEDIAGEAHLNTRFARDARFPRERVAELYRTWIRKECAGAADQVLVVEAEGAPAGYVTCQRGDGGPGKISLIAVRKADRRRGAGTALLRAALEWFGTQGVDRVSVVTQGHDVAAMRLYERTGFLTASVELWFHLWLI